MSTAAIQSILLAERRTPAPASVSIQRHVTALDGIRGLAVFAVMVFHLAPRPWGHSTIDHVIGRVFSFGWCGVDLFFVLSGFLITGILLDAKGANGYFKTFYARRTLRIFPLYYGLLFAVFIVLPAIGRSLYEDARRDQAWFWLYSTNVIDGIKAFPYRSLNHLWSLAVEEQFYLVWPLLVFLLSPRGLVRICWGCIAVAILSRSFFIFCHSMPFQPVWLTLPSPVAAYTLTFCRIDGLACGALVAISVRYQIAGNARRFWENRLCWMILAAAIVAMLTYAPTVVFKDPIIESLGLSLLAFFFATTVGITAASSGISARLFSLAPLVFLGKYSYALYLFHPLIHHLSIEYFSHFAPRWLILPGQSQGWVVGGAAFVASILAAWISWHVFEAPILSLKRFFPSPKARPRQMTMGRTA